MITVVKISRRALKDLKRTPRYIQEKFRAWLFTVNKVGLETTRQSPGWHDESLQGDRKGQRSIRLNKQWCAIYVLQKDDGIELIEVREVTPHDY